MDYAVCRVPYDLAGNPLGQTEREWNAVLYVLDYLAGGMTENWILADFPQLSRESIWTCLAHAADRERRLVPSQAA